jgi:hypothetical protein
MNILLLHAEDRFEDLPQRNWDLVIDFARAPTCCYERWAQLGGGSVVSLYDFSKEIDDLHRLRDLLAPGMGGLVDRWGLDWWDIASLHLSEQLLQLILIARLAETLPARARLRASRSCCLADALANILGSKVTVLHGARVRALRGMVSHYPKVFLQSDGRQLVQSALDKFDRRHRLRKLFGPAVRPSGESFVLVPSAYINVSRTAVTYARAAADQNFLLVHARPSGKLKEVPDNVRTLDLSAFFSRPDAEEMHSLLSAWDHARDVISRSAPELAVAAATGILDAVPRTISWGIGVRDAWNRVLDSHHIVSCFCADNSNAYSRIPLMLCKQRGIPSLACHHGALDFRMAFKRQHADRYLAKNEMELDYLREVCGMESSEILIPAAPATNHSSPSTASMQARDWLVFFTEPYGIGAWRTDEVYALLLPELARVARQTGLQLIIKLHPFESLRHFRRLTKRLLSAEERARTQIISTGFSSEQWARTRFAVAVESSVAIECGQRGIPMFLLAWLRNLSYGYLRQFQKFHVGYVVESPAEMSGSPERLRELESQPFAAGTTGYADIRHSLSNPAAFDSAVAANG